MTSVPADLGAEAGLTLEGYLERLRVTRGLSPHTLRNYRTDLGHFLRWLSERGIELAGAWAARLPRLPGDAARGRDGGGEHSAAGEHNQVVRAASASRGSATDRPAGACLDPEDARAAAEVARAARDRRAAGGAGPVDAGRSARPGDVGGAVQLRGAGQRADGDAGGRLRPRRDAVRGAGQGRQRACGAAGRPGGAGAARLPACGPTGAGGRAGEPLAVAEPLRQAAVVARGAACGCVATQRRRGWVGTCIRICCDTHSPRICSMEAPISASFRSCWGTRVSRRPSCIRTSPSAASEPPSKTPWTGYRSCCASGGRNERPPMRVEPSENAAVRGADRGG